MIEKYMDSPEISTNELLKQPIPIEAGQVPARKEIPIKECGELLVPLGPFTDFHQIATNSIYFGERADSLYRQLEGSLMTMFTRKGAAEKLAVAQKILPYNMYLVVFDSYRSLQVQQSLYDAYYNPLKELHPEYDDKELAEMTQGYVSLPSSNPNKPSPHNTGGSVDVIIYKLPELANNQVKAIDQQIASLYTRKLPLYRRMFMPKEKIKEWEKTTGLQAFELEMQKMKIINEQAHLLDFGTAFDYGDKEAALTYYEQLSQTRELAKKEIEQRDNRRFLYNVMTAAEFQGYKDEWWHFNYGNQMAASTVKDLFAIYGAAIFSAENQEFENIKLGHRERMITMRKGLLPANKLGCGLYELTKAFQLSQKSNKRSRY